jgi:hypothetical protein
MDSGGSVTTSTTATTNESIGISWPFLALKMSFCFVLDDVCFYCYHRLLHSSKFGLYERFHKPHHLFKAPFAWTSHAVHPVEMALQSVGTMAGPLLFSMFRPFSFTSANTTSLAATSAASAAALAAALATSGGGGVASAASRGGECVGGMCLEELWVWLAVRQWFGVLDHTVTHLIEVFNL